VALDIYQIVTDKIIESLNQGVVPWQKPWNPEVGLPRSLSTKKAYRGLNIFLLGLSAQINGYSSPWWGTYKQIEARGGQVRKGEKSTLVIFWKRLEKEEVRDDGSIKNNSFMMLRYFNVFNASQCDELEVPAIKGESKLTPHEGAQEIVRTYLSSKNHPEIVKEGTEASYSPSRDCITMPVRTSFHNTESYYGTLFHEMTHSTGHSSRLNREGVVENHKFGDELYSAEELVAEMGAAMLCGVAGINWNVENSAAYIGSWLKALKGDQKLVVKAAGLAQKAADLIQGISYGEMEGE